MEKKKRRTREEVIKDRRLFLEKKKAAVKASLQKEEEALRKDEESIRRKNAKEERKKRAHELILLGTVTENLFTMVAKYIQQDNDCLEDIIPMVLPPLPLEGEKPKIAERKRKDRAETEQLLRTIIERINIHRPKAENSMANNRPLAADATSV